jgi:hypothetical protein
LIQQHRAVKNGGTDLSERGPIRERARQQHFAEERRRHGAPVPPVRQRGKHFDGAEFKRKVQQIIGLQPAIGQQAVAVAARQACQDARIIAHNHFPRRRSREDITEPLWSSTEEEVCIITKRCTHPRKIPNNKHMFALTNNIKI